MGDLTSLFENRRNMLEKNKYIFDSFIIIFSPEKKFKPNLFEKKIGIKLPLVLADFYQECDGFQLIWSANIENKTVTGYSILYSNSYFLSKKVDLQQGDSAGFWKKGISQTQQDLLEKYFILENIGYSNYVLCDLISTPNEPQLFLYLSDNRIYKINLNFTDYIQKVIEYCGIYLWQRYFCPEYQVSPLDLEDDCAKYLSILIKDINTSPFINNVLHLPQVPNSIQHRTTIESKISTFKKQTKIKELALNIPLGAPIGVLAKAQYTLNQKLPIEIANFFYQLNGLKFNWTKGKHGGSIGILPLENIIGGPIEKDGQMNKDWHQELDYFGTFWFDDEADNAGLMKKMRPFDIPSGSSDLLFVDFLSEKQPILYYVVARDNEYRLPFSIAEYFNYLVNFMGTYDWYLLFIKGKSVKIGDFLLIDYIKSILPELTFDNIKE